LPRSWRKNRSALIAVASPSVQEAAKAEITRAATRLLKLVAFADQITLPTRSAEAARNAGLLPKYRAVGTQKKF